MAEKDGPGFKFWAAAFGIVIAAGIGGLIVFAIFSRAVYVWGFFGAFMVVVLILLGVAWFYDRRQVRDYGAE